MLFGLLADAEQFQFSKIYAALAVHRERCITLAEAFPSTHQKRPARFRKFISIRAANSIVNLLANAWSSTRAASVPKS